MNDALREDLLKTYKSLNLSGGNEAATRLKLIDRVIFELLGWERADVSPEERVSEDGTREYADYVIRTANAALVIEAKRVGIAFWASYAKRKAALNGPLMQGETKDAIIQARDYCRKLSIPFAVITNGSQWIIFPATRVDQVPFDKSTAIVFDSIESCLGEDFEYFYQLLSREGIINGNIHLELLGRTENQFSERRLSSFNIGHRPVVKNPIYPLIEQEVLKAFSDTITEITPDLFDKCYVRTSDRTRFDTRIRMHLAKRSPLFSASPLRPMSRKNSRALDEKITQLSSSSRPLAVVALGSVGVGKTMFLTYTRKVSSADYFEQKLEGEYPHWIYIDFRSFDPETSAHDYIIEKIFEYISNDPYFSTYERAIRSAYKEEFSSLKRGPLKLLASDSVQFDKLCTEMLMKDYQQKTPYVEKLLAYGATKAPVFLVIDNMDQVEQLSAQNKIFSSAISLSTKLKLCLVIAMRESTFVRHRNTPLLDAYDFDPLQLESPEILSVLSRRFLVVKELLKGKNGSFIALNGAHFKVNDLSVFIDLVQRSVLGTEVGRQIEVLANRDVRLALRMTREFLERGYTDPAKALQVYGETHEYVMPPHEAFRSILLGNQPYYSDKHSVIANPFDAKLGKSQSQLLRLFILTGLVNKLSVQSSDGIEGPDIRTATRSLGFPDSDVLKVLTDLCTCRYAHTASHHEPDFASTYFPSRLGGHLVRELISNFTFIENVMMDTFVSSEPAWNQLKQQTEDIRSEKNSVSKLSLRVSRAKVFYKEMKDKYSDISIDANRRSLNAVWCSNPLEDAETDFNENCAKALRSAKKRQNVDNHH